MQAAQIVLFESSDGLVKLPVEVDAARADVWLTRQQMAKLFGRDVKTIGKHINNALNEELAGDVARTVAKNATVRMEGNRRVSRQVQYYSLDVIISVGYRVKSPRGVEFRRWATGVLHDYVVKGYAANKARLHQLGQAVDVIARLPEGDVDVRQVVDIIRSYTTALDLLDDYDNKTLHRPKGSDGSYVLTYDECREVIANMRFGNESSLFGVEKDESFRASIGDIYASFAGQEAYPSAEDKAANLLYFVVKNHSFLVFSRGFAPSIASCQICESSDRSPKGHA